MVLLLHLSVSLFHSCHLCSAGFALNLKRNQERKKKTNIFSVFPPKAKRLVDSDLERALEQQQQGSEAKEDRRIVAVLEVEL